MRLTHGRIALELHTLAHGAGPSLLLLHALYGSSRDWGEAPAAWPGPVFALDFSGHGCSDWLTGAGYTPELLLADADVALAHIGNAAVAGAGFGAYIALLLAGARSDVVPAAMLLPGAGMDGGGPWPDFRLEFPTWFVDGAATTATSSAANAQYDPMVRSLELFVRPVDYVEAFARTARRLVFVEDGEPKPPWWQAARDGTNTESAAPDLGGALGRMAEIISRQR